MSGILIARRVRVTVMQWMIIEAVPFLNRFRRESGWVHSLEDLRQFPVGTWGAGVVQFLDARGFDDFLPNYESHDALHTLLGYETNITGELRLQAFMIGNGGASFPGQVLFILGCLILPELWPQLRLDFMRGYNSARLRMWDVPAMLNSDLTLIRTKIALRHDLQTIF